MSTEEALRLRSEFNRIPSGPKPEDKLYAAERRIRRLERAVESLLKDKNWNPNCSDFLRE